MQHRSGSNAPPPTADSMTSEGGLKELRDSVKGLVEWYIDCSSLQWSPHPDGDSFMQELNKSAAMILAKEVSFQFALHMQVLTPALPRLQCFVSEIDVRSWSPTKSLLNLNLCKTGLVYSYTCS
jgi:hypothetical protein